MKTVFRMLISTLATAAVLYLLRFTYTFFVAESMLGATVDHIVVLCLLALAAVSLLLYLRCWLSLLVDGIRWLVRKSRRRQPVAATTGVQLNILPPDGSHRRFLAEMEKDGKN